MHHELYDNLKKNNKNLEYKERKEDCFFCKNLHFSFRNYCNICQRPKKRIFNDEK